MLELEGIRDPDTTTNIIREALWLAFQIDPASISFVDMSDGFDPKINPEPGGDPESQDKGPPMRKAYVGFNVQMAAKNLELEVEGIEGGKKFIVNEEVVTFRVLTHKKESEYRTQKFGSPEESKPDQSPQEHSLNWPGPGSHDAIKSNNSSQASRWDDGSKHDERLQDHDSSRVDKSKDYERPKDYEKSRYSERSIDREIHMQQERASYPQEGLNSESSRERDRERSLDNKMSKCWDGPRRHDSSKDNKGEGHKSGESYSEDWLTLDEL